jgi:four helix bundle protein
VATNGFRSLRVYVLASELADWAFEEVASWDRLAKWSVGVHLVRAADSVAANIAEAMGRENAADGRRLLVIARCSLFETEHWLLTAERRGLIAESSAQRAEELAKPLAGLIRRPR